WTLQYLKQNNIGELTATLFKDNLVRADNLPLVLPVMGADGLPRGAHVRVRLGAVDDITLDIHGTVVERLDLPGEDLADDSSDSGEDDEALAAPLALAIDVDDVGTPAEATTTENAV
ncbi:MAG: RNB domain-containing ribonuclease, partial [Hydrogenophaga sp.]|nr:RNB domain-containing ribonuclease [Hydrogenophaga sp.]